VRAPDVLKFFEKFSPRLVGVQASGAGHYWASGIAALGHHVLLIPPAYVRRFVKGGEMDAAIAEAICEELSRKTTRFVPIKSAEQQAGSARTSRPSTHSGHQRFTFSPVIKRRKLSALYSQLDIPSS
jgi:transposase